jgi:hypothetical protein
MSTTSLGTEPAYRISPTVSILPKNIAVTKEAVGMIVVVESDLAFGLFTKLSDVPAIEQNFFSAKCAEEFV